MTTATLFLLRAISWALAGAAALLAAWFNLRDAWQTDDDRKRTSAWYGAKWRVIRDRGWLDLPENAIRWLLASKDKLPEIAEFMTDKLQTWQALAALAVAGVLGLWLQLDPAHAIALGSVLVVLSVVQYLEDTRSVMSPDWLVEAIAIPAAIVAFISCFAWLNWILKLPILWATLALLALLPIYAVVVMMALFLAAALVAEYVAPKLSATYIMDFGVAMSLSFVVTLGSLLVGSYFSPASHIPMTIQMLASNVTCDGVTLLASLVILRHSIGEGRLYAIPIAVFLDLIVGAALASASLYLALVGTEKAISLVGVVNVLIARSPDGSAFELGPYFWAMHTAFLPTLLYLSLISLCLLGKWVILPIGKILGRGEMVDAPHRLTALCFAFVAVLFAVVGSGLQLYSSQFGNVGP